MRTECLLAAIRGANTPGKRSPVIPAPTRNGRSGCDDGMADFLWTQSVDRCRGHDAFTDILFSARSRGLPSHSEEETKGKTQSGNYKGHEGTQKHEPLRTRKSAKELIYPLSFGDLRAPRGYRFSKIPAAPMPPPTHIVTIP